MKCARSSEKDTTLGEFPVGRCTTKPNPTVGIKCCEDPVEVVQSYMYMEAQPYCHTEVRLRWAKFQLGLEHKGTIQHAKEIYGLSMIQDFDRGKKTACSVVKDACRRSSR